MSVKSSGLATAKLLAILATAFAVSSSARCSFAQETTQANDAKRNLQAQKLVGTWKLEEASTPGSPSGVGTRLKMFTGTHWCVIQPDPTTGEIVFVHGGRYEFDGDTLTTTRDFAGESTKDMIGRTGKFKLKIDGDVMKQADSEGVYNETWKRVK
jgi:hypothetical protein